MAFWGGRKLFDELGRGKIITPFDPQQIDCNAYTLRMGAECYVTPDYGSWLRKNKKEILKKPKEFQTPLGKIPFRGGRVVIPSGQFAFLLTEEHIEMPAEIMGFISLKSAVKFKGLINVSGFHVDPGFNGHLIYSVFNAGPSAIHIQRGDLLFLLWLADLSGPAEPEYRKNMPVPQIEIPTALISGVAKEVQSIQRLSERIDFAERRLGTLWNGAIIVSVLVAIFLAYLQVQRPAGNAPPKVNSPALQPPLSPEVPPK
jgi:dCTP deaminase